VIRIEAPHFVAAVILDRYGKVVRAAPILRYMTGWQHSRVERYAASKGWTWQYTSESW
jgi:hypothetical protein